MSEIILPDRSNRHRWYGCIADTPDHRDRKSPFCASGQVPAVVDLSPNFPLPPFNQAELGACGANAAAGVITYDQKKQGLPVVMPSRLFIYYNTRVLEGTTGYDSGVQIRDVFKAYNRWGECPEKDWPYHIVDFKQKPPTQAYTDAAQHKPILYSRVEQSLQGLQGSLLAGFPVEIGFTVYESFESDAVAETGVVAMPGSNEVVVGGHAVVLCGYDMNHSTWLVRNSWGDSGWGLPNKPGYFTLPLAYLLNDDLASDFWMCEHIK